MSELNIDNFPPTERRILRILSDGKDHHKDELKKQLYTDGHGANGALYFHICNIRKKLKEVGQDIVCFMSSRHGFMYRQVRSLHPIKSKSETNNS